MEDKSLQLMTEKELDIHNRFEQCTTIEELKQLEEELNLLNEDVEDIQYKSFDMPIEEFKEKYGYVDIKDLKGKYGF